MCLSNILKITLTDFEKANKKLIGKEGHWFKFYTNIFHDPRIASLSASTFKFYTYLCALATEKGCVSYTIDTRDCARVTRLRHDSITIATMSLEQNQLLTIQSEHKIDREDRKDTVDIVKKNDLSSTALYEARFKNRAAAAKIDEYLRFILEVEKLDFNIKRHLTRLTLHFENVENLKSVVDSMMESKTWKELYDNKENGNAWKRYIIGSLLQDAGIIKKKE